MKLARNLGRKLLVDRAVRFKFPLKKLFELMVTSDRRRPQVLLELVPLGLTKIARWPTRHRPTSILRLSNELKIELSVRMRVIRFMSRVRADSIYLWCVLST